ncbi:hypothetical protein ACLOJK_016467 [Asimina triloba]
MRGNGISIESLSFTCLAETRRLLQHPFSISFLCILPPLHPHKFRRKMASISGAAGFTLALFFFVLASMPGINEASRRIIVGGDDGWKFGFNYAEWARKDAPFYQNDTLVFKYDPPNTAKHPHNVLLLKNRKSYRSCDVQNARIVADETQGGGSGFEFVLGDRKRYFFACGMKNGVHCMFGNMKFYVSPLAKSA